MTIMKTLSVSLAILSLGTSGAAMAATDGLEGVVTSGIVQVSAQLNLGDKVRISGLEDVDFGLIDQFGDIEKGTYFCIFRNTPGNIRFRVYDSSSPQSLALIGQSGSIPLNLRIVLPNTGTQAINSNQDVVFAPSPVSCNPNGGFGTPGNFGIDFISPHGTRNNAPNGQYNASVTITASIE